MVKEQFRETDGAKKISHITFGLMSPMQMRNQSHLNVVALSMYEPNTRIPVANGVLDRRLGVGSSEKDKLCETCGKNPVDCVGHFGYIDLELPCFHVGYFRSTVNILNCICKNCSRVLMSPSVKEAELKTVSKPNLSYLDKKKHRKRIHKKITDSYKKVDKCPYCSAYNGFVKKCGFLKIMHTKYKHDKSNTPELVQEFVKEFDEAIRKNTEIKSYLSKTQEILTPLNVFYIFSKIPVEDIPLLLMNPECSRPVDLLLSRLIVPPLSIRPSIISNLESNEDDITLRLTEILMNNHDIAKAKVGSSVTYYMEQWIRLQVVTAQLYNSEVTGIPPVFGNQQQGKPRRGFIQRLKGKQGRFRGNLSGKRVDFSGRTVISPDPNLRIDQVGVPMHMAKILTYPEKVTPGNIEFLKKLILNGDKVHPGAVFVDKKDGSRLKLFAPMAGQRAAKELQYGDTVRRHLNDGDVILFNRQPSLHRLSIQAFFAKVSPNRTLSFNECCCNPFNADFDGDEMNLHLPQTEEAKAEALILMGSKSNIITPRNGDPLIAAIQDFITGSYLMTQKDTFFDQTMAQQLVTSIVTRDDPSMSVTLPPAAIRKPCKLWTGKQLFSLIIRPNIDCPVKANVRAKCSGKRHDDKAKQEYRCADCRQRLVLGNPQLCRRCVDYNKFCKKEEMDPNDMFVVISNSELLAGYMEKGNLGSGSKTNIFYVILRDFGEKYAADALVRLSRMISSYIGNKGFSIGIEDVTPGAGLIEAKRGLLRSGYNECDGYIKKFQQKHLEAQPGFTIEETLEAVLLKELSNIRESAADSCLKELHKTNSPLIMALCGSKGSNINISQMIACVGQQSVSGHRVPEEFDKRSLMYFPKLSKDPAARGFVENSFHSGLIPTEVFFHTVAGREGLVDTAVKTAETGYMQRRLIKVLEDLCVNYDNTVRNSMGDVIQFTYGSDGLDPSAMEARYTKSKNKKPTGTEGWRPVDFNRVMYQVCKEIPCRGDILLTADQTYDILRHEIDKNLGKEMCKYKLQTGSQKKMRIGCKKEDREPEETQMLHSEQETSQTTSMEQEEAQTKNLEQDGTLEETVDQQNTQLAKGPLMDFEKDHFPEQAKNFGRHLEKFLTGLISNIRFKGTRPKSEFCSIDHVTLPQLSDFLERCSRKFARARAEPGMAVGALAAQSIGEPGTQMTLKTFHFAGVASMNITQGVPRIKEIINASKAISTPIVVCPLEKKNDKDFARLVKGRIEKTTLGQIAASITEVYQVDDVFLLIRLDMTRIRLLKLEVNAGNVRDAILAKKGRLKFGDIKVYNEEILTISPPINIKDCKTVSKFYVLKQYKGELPKIVVKGISTVKRAVMQVLDKKDEEGNENYELVVEGTNLLAVMTTPGVKGELAVSNHVSEVYQTLGIEAARATIINEMKKTMSSHGISVDVRHFMLLADVMCHMGDVLGISRGGMAKMRESVLMLASFEQMADHLYEAAYHGQRDAIRGVTESIIMGVPMTVGTGHMHLLQKHEKTGSKTLPAREHVFDTEDLF